MENCNSLMHSKLSGGGRIAYIDALRGFTMLLVVFWHVEYVAYGAQSANSVINYILMTFRMPTFFFISGYIAYKIVNKWNLRFYFENLRKKALVQIVPTIVFFSILRFFTGENPFQFLIKGFGEFWFTIVLFEMFVLYFTLSLIGRYVNGKIVDLGLIFIVLVAELTDGFDNHLNEIFSLNLLLPFFKYFAIGILCQKYKYWFVKFIESNCFRTIVILVFAIGILMCFNNDFKISVPFAYKFLYAVIVRFAGILLVFIFFYSKAAYFESGVRLSRVMQFVGRRTLDIYMLHYFMIPAIHSHKITYLAPFISTESMAITRFAVSMGIAVLVVAACLLVSEVIRTSPTLAHYLFGAKRK